MEPLRPLAVRCSVQRYDWGKIGKNSLVNRLSGTKENRPGAELWLGDHEKGRCLLEDGEQKTNLSSFLANAQEEVLGTKIVGAFNRRIPFLFKVLSIGTPLSVQVHPDRKEAEELHASDPLHYPDINHKPELAIALTRMSLLHGVRSTRELGQAFALVPEFASICKDMGGHSEVLAQLLSAPVSVIREANQSLLTRLNRKPSNRLSPEELWVLKTAPMHAPDDPGLLCFFVLRLLTLQPGEAVFTPSGVPHAYLEGDLIECMANSDNVVRAALTSKNVDRQVFLKVSRTSPNGVPCFKPVARNGFLSFNPSVAEFAVDLFPQPGHFTLEVCDALQLLYSVDAEGCITTVKDSFPVQKGSAYLIPAGMKRFELDLKKGGFYRVRVP